MQQNSLVVYLDLSQPRYSFILLTWDESMNVLQVFRRKFACMIWAARLRLKFALHLRSCWGRAILRSMFWWAWPVVMTRKVIIRDWWGWWRYQNNLFRRGIDSKYFWTSGLKLPLGSKTVLAGSSAHSFGMFCKSRIQLALTAHIRNSIPKHTMLLLICPLLASHSAASISLPKLLHHFDFVDCKKLPDLYFDPSINGCRHAWDVALWYHAINITSKNYQLASSVTFTSLNYCMVVKIVGKNPSTFLSCRRRERVS